MKEEARLIDRARAKQNSLLKAPVNIRSLRITTENQQVLNDITINIAHALYALEEMRLMYKAAPSGIIEPRNMVDMSAYLISLGRRSPYPLYYHPASDVAIVEVLDEKLRDTGRGVVVNLAERRLLAEVKLSPVSPRSNRKNVDPLQPGWFKANASVRGNRTKCFCIGDQPHVFDVE